MTSTKTSHVRGYYHNSHAGDHYGTRKVGRRIDSAQEAGADPMPAEPESICIVDDDASVRNSIKQLLDSDGLEAQTFQDGEDFLAYAGSHTVRLAIVDVSMPKTSGLEVQARLQPLSPNTRVIVVTGQEIPGIRAASLKGGAFAFLLKPFEGEPFLALVRQALG